MISSTKFDPFNHGISSISYREISSNSSKLLENIIRQGWNISEIKQIVEQDGGRKINSNNFKIKSSTRSFFLKKSNINNTKDQRLINDCIHYMETKNVPVTKIISTIDGKLFFVDQSNIYCLYNFISGEHFDGSRKELTAAATEVAKLTTILQTIPFESQIKRKRKFSYHNQNLLKKSILAKSGNLNNDPVDILVQQNYKEILEISKRIYSNLEILNHLPSQVTHGDLHPHNILFDSGSKKLLAFLDFDELEFGPRIRSVGHVMHRFCRTYGEKTERKQDDGADIRSRLKLFLEAYCDKANLTPGEIDNLGLIVADCELKGLTTILNNHYLQNNFDWDFDLEKRITTLREAVAFF